jgi:hypothetical protein
MGYIINRYNGTVLTTVEDGTINLTTEVKLIGRNFAGYGEAQNENFLHLMENFSGPTPPGKPLNGMIWYDSNINKIKFYDGNRWKTASSAEVNTIQPIGNVEGDLWWNSTTNQLYSRSSQGEWILVGPQTTVLGFTQFLSRSIQGFDSLGAPREYSIIQAILSDDNGNESTPLIISSADFTVNTDIAGNAIDDFTTVVKKGITLADTNSIGMSTDTLLWGTASNAQRLGGFLSSDFVKINELDFQSNITVNNVMSIDSEGFNGIIENLADQVIIFRVNNGSFQQSIARINLLGLIPEQDNTYDIGTTALRWKDIHAVNFLGTATRANQLRVGTGSSAPYRIAAVPPTPDTIAARDSSGNLQANLFQGTATTARYADLAEKYTTEKQWPVGTAMAVCDHPDHETCPATSNNIAIGVISDKPAYLMNSESEGQAIALVGRVPVRVIGSVTKGQAVYALNAGVCSTIVNQAMVGIALETNLDEEEKLVECILKV